jgi:polyphosphate kinase
MSRWFGNRELSWLDFNGRVLALAKETSIPLLERMKFLAIFSSNLDEFFQVRVAALKGQVAAGLMPASSDGLSPQRQLREIARYVDNLVNEHEHLLLDVLIPELRSHDVGIVRWDELTATEQSVATTYFHRQLFPVLTPLAVDPAHPFPYVSNLAISLGVLVRNPLTMEQRFARVKVPTLIKRFYEVSEGRFVPVEDVIAAHIGELFEGMTIVHVTTFRVTRNADLTLESRRRFVSSSRDGVATPSLWSRGTP